MKLHPVVLLFLLSIVILERLPYLAQACEENPLVDPASDDDNDDDFFAMDFSTFRPVSYYEGPRDRLGKPHGQGRLNFVTGGYYTGAWVHGVKQGYGRLHTAYGFNLDGVWSNGLTRNIDTLRGSYAIWKGEKKAGKRQGKGMLCCGDGYILRGSWINGRFDPSQGSRQTIPLAVQPGWPAGVYLLILDSPSPEEATLTELFSPSPTPVNEHRLLKVRELFTSGWEFYSFT